MRFCRSAINLALEGSWRTDLKLDIQAQVLFCPCTIPAPLLSVHYTALSSVHAALRLHNMLYQIFSRRKREVRGGSFGRAVIGYLSFLRVKRRMLDVS